MLQNKEPIVQKKLKTSKYKNISDQVEEIRRVLRGEELHEGENDKRHLKYPARKTLTSSKRGKNLL